MATIVITGSNRGLGLEFVKQYHDLGHTVYALCRKPSSELVKLGVEVVKGIDITKSDCVEKILNVLGDQKIDILINNAGILRDDGLKAIKAGKFESIQDQFEANAIGPLRVTAGLLDNIKAPGGKIAMITSRMGSISDNSVGGFYGYRPSKAALNMIGKNLSVDLKDKGIAVGCFHPGFVQTDFTGYQGNISPEDAAKATMKWIDNLDMENTGSFWHQNGEIIPW